MASSAAGHYLIVRDQVVASRDQVCRQAQHETKEGPWRLRIYARFDYELGVKGSANPTAMVTLL